MEEFFKFSKNNYIRKLINQLKTGYSFDSDEFGLCSGIAFYILENILRRVYPCIGLGKREICLCDHEAYQHHYQCHYSLNKIYHLAKNYFETINKAG
ncbi:hypothetical protein ID853_01070 [Xenorhabdus sp. Vera]|uniref:hypothetical protein n=1 Tax=Xenorhabdus koppenhoeferi TaxID=351659 RepID=UPI001987AE07|nr:hypothetical protein [Xenorhabdus sp. Vera]MBD2809507.1 hypothetical protein [Xenorhabdus sp. Vera]